MGPHYHAVFVALGLAHDHRMPLEVHIFHPQAHPSINRMPVPYSRRANKALMSTICAKRPATSSLVKTEGMRLVC